MTIERGKTMKRTHLLAILVSLTVITILTVDASAYYHPTMGRFISRDPGPGGSTRVGTAGPATGSRFIPRDPTGTNQYADGMSLYLYAQGTPTNFRDPKGLAVDPGIDCKLYYMGKFRKAPDEGQELGKRAKKPMHAWLAEGDPMAKKKAVWDFGPDKAWMDQKFGKGKWTPMTCTWGTICEGQKDYGDVYYGGQKKQEFDAWKLKLKWDLGFWVNTLKEGKDVKGKKCKCASCKDIKTCLQAVEDRWDKEKKYEWVWSNCILFALDAMNKCCLRF